MGAGLHILTTLRDNGSRPFSALVAETREKGFTEPDPRDDLSGTDVARKLVILAREMGLPLELHDVEVESLVPPELAAVDVDGFLHGLGRFDEAMERRRADAASQGRVLRFVGRVDAEGRAAARIEALPAEHPFASMDLTDNVVRFVSDRYADNALVVRGPGAGPAVTAAGVFADLLRLCSGLGADVDPAGGSGRR